MFRLKLGQRFFFGFVVIMILLTISGGTSFWNLADINRSNKRVNEIAVPVVQQGNHLQIQLLKLANLGGLAFNAQDTDEIQPFQAEFTTTAAAFGKLYQQVEVLTERDHAMQPLVVEVQSHYQKYLESMQAMFLAKLDALQAKQRTDEETDQLIELLDAVLKGITEIKFYSAPADYAADMEIAAGAADQAETYFAHMANEFMKIPRAQEADELKTLFMGLIDNIGYGMEQINFADSVFRPFDQEGLLDTLHERINALQQRMEMETNVVTHKQEQLALRQQAMTWFQTANRSVN